MSARQFDGISVGFARFKGETFATCGNGEQRTQFQLTPIAPLFSPAIGTINLDLPNRATSVLGYFRVPTTALALPNHFAFTPSGRILRSSLHLLSALGHHSGRLFSLFIFVLHREKKAKVYSEHAKYAIRAKTSAAMRTQIAAASDSDWLPLLDRQGEAISGQDTYRTSFCIGDYEKAFTLIIQKTATQGQASLDLDSPTKSDEISQGGYVYRAIATNRDELSDSQVIHWYNQRAEGSENRIKELKLDFGGDALPCSDFNANALYFLISAQSYNLFALMRQLLPEELTHHRAMTLRWRLYAIAAKVVRTGRQLFVKLKEKHRILLVHVLPALKEFEPQPIPMYVNTNGVVLSAADNAPVLLRLLADKRQGIAEQFKVLRAKRHVSSEHHHRTVAFFDAYA